MSKNDQFEQYEVYGQSINWKSLTDFPQKNVEDHETTEDNNSCVGKLFIFNKASAVKMIRPKTRRTMRVFPTT